MSARRLAGTVGFGVALAITAIAFLPACDCPTCTHDCVGCDASDRYCLRLREYGSRGERHAYCVYLPDECVGAATCECVLASLEYKDVEDVLSIASEATTCSGDATSGIDVDSCTTGAVCPDGCEDRNDCSLYCCHLD